MARDTRTLSLKILADIDDLKKKLNEADGSVETSSSKIADYGKKAAAAFAVAAAAAVAYAGKLAIDGVKAAIEDEQAQLRLANALRQATGATDAQIKATEDFILQTSLATGVADEQLRPAMQRLAVSTKDTEQAQKLLSLALDISKGSGKDLEQVATALGRAHDGQTTALGRLGLGLSAAELKTMSFTEIQQALADLYGGAASKNAETFQGKIDRIKVAFDEAKESLGVALLPQIEKFITFLNDQGIPALNGFIAGLTGDEGLSAGLAETQRSAEGFGKAISSVIGIVQGFITFIREAIGLVVSLANELIRVVNIIPGVNIGSIPNPAPSANRSSVPSVPKGSSAFTYGAGNPQYNITVNGAIDAEGTARTIVNTLNNSQARGGVYVGTPFGQAR